MEGVLERGQMIAAPPLGYCIDWSRGRPGDGHVGGARWAIDPPQADLMRELFARRAAGESVYSLAKSLNLRGVPTPRRARDGGPGYWRGATISRMLANPIYRGLFVYQGSAYTRMKMRRKWQQPKLTPYAREAFRLVSDELWAKCNPAPGERKLRGGRKHVLAGLLVCGACESTLCIVTSRTSETLHCATCEQAVRVGALASWVGYTSVPAATLALKAALKELVAGPALEEFRRRLKARLVEGPGAEEAHLRAKLQQLSSARQKLLQLSVGTNPSAWTLSRGSWPLCRLSSKRYRPGCSAWRPSARRSAHRPSRSRLPFGWSRCSTACSAANRFLTR